MMMKKQYSIPRIFSHGTIENITQAIGTPIPIDTIFFSGEPISAGVGISVDTILNPDGSLTFQK